MSDAQARLLRLVALAAAALASVATAKATPAPSRPHRDCSAVDVDLLEWTAERVLVQVRLAESGCHARILGARAFVDGADSPPVDGPELAERPVTLTFSGFSLSSPAWLDLQIDSSYAVRYPLRNGQLGPMVRIAPIIAPASPTTPR